MRKIFSLALILFIAFALLTSCHLSGVRVTGEKMEHEPSFPEFPFEVTAQPSPGWHIDNTIDKYDTTLLSIFKDEGYGVFGIYYLPGDHWNVNSLIGFFIEDVPRREGGRCGDIRDVMVGGYPGKEVTYTQLIGGMEEIHSQTYVLVDGSLLDIRGIAFGAERLKISEPAFTEMRDSIRIIT